MAERNRTTDETLRRTFESEDGLALLERNERPEAEDGELEDGETVAEDSGAGSFLDRFIPPRPRRV